MRRKIRNRNRNIIAHPRETYCREPREIIDLTSTQTPNDTQAPTPLPQTTHRNGNNTQLENARAPLGLPCQPSSGYVSLPVWGVPSTRRLLKWTEGEDTFLQSVMYNSPIPWWDVMRVLPHRTQSAISQRMVMLRALAKNIRRELDLVLANRHVEVIVIDDDDDPRPDVPAAARGDSADTGGGEPQRESGDARTVHDTAAVGRNDKDVEDGNGVVREEKRAVREEGIEKGYAPSVDEIRGICERAVDVEHVPEDGKQESDEEDGLIGAKRVAELLNEEECNDEKDDEIEEFVFVAPPRDGEEAFNRRGDDMQKAEKVEKVEKVGFADRKREHGINDCDDRKRRKKDENVVVI